MRVHGVLVTGVAFCILLLPLVCLCQFVPGQTQRAPYLMLFPLAHTPAVDTLSDDALIDLAMTTGQAVSVTDEGDVTLGYGTAAPPFAATTGASLARQGMPAEQHPQLNATVPGGPPIRRPPPLERLRLRVPEQAPQDDPAPPTPPPRAA